MEWNHSGFGVTQRMVVGNRQEHRERKLSYFLTWELERSRWGPLHEVDPHRCWGFVDQTVHSGCQFFGGKRS